MKLYNYQKRTAEFCKTNDKIIISQGCGLGKTTSILHYIDEAKPKSLLIVAPKFVANNVWTQENSKWKLDYLAEKLTIVTGDTPKKKRIQLLQDNNFIVLGRDNLNDIKEAFPKGKKFDILVMDELTSFKNHASKRSEAIYNIKANQRIGLTGTLITNSAVDVYGQFLAVGYGNELPKRERNNMFYRWRARHFKDVLAGSGLQFQKWKLITPLEQLIAKVRPSIFTLDSKDYLEIPEVSYIEHMVQLTTKEMNEYLRLNTMLAVKLNDEVVAFTEAQKFAKLQTLCNGFVYVDEGKYNRAVRSEHSTKLDEVAEFVVRAVNEGEQVVVFYSFTEEKDWLTEKLKKQGVTISGTHDKDFLSKWNEREVDVLLLHAASAGHGLSLHLSGCRLMVWSSLPFDLELYKQANARLTRQGQKRGVQIHSFMTKGTVEPKKYTQLNKKDELLTEFIELTK